MDDISEWMLWMIWISKIRKKNAMIGFEPSQKKISHPSSQTCFNMWASRTTHRAMCLCVFSASSPSWSICWEVPKLDRWSLIATTKELSARYWKLFLYAWFSIDLKSLKKKQYLLNMSVSQIHSRERKGPIQCYVAEGSQPTSIWISDSYLQMSIGGTTNNNVGCYPSIPTQQIDRRVRNLEIIRENISTASFKKIGPCDVS